jgi:hypothetical protein
MTLKVTYHTDFTTNETMVDNFDMDLSDFVNNKCAELGIDLDAITKIEVI